MKPSERFVSAGSILKDFEHALRLGVVVAGQHDPGAGERLCGIEYPPDRAIRHRLGIKHITGHHFGHLLRKRFAALHKNHVDRMVFQHSLDGRSQGKRRHIPGEDKRLPGFGIDRPIPPDPHDNLAGAGSRHCAANRHSRRAGIEVARVKLFVDRASRIGNRRSRSNRNQPRRQHHGK